MDVLGNVITSNYINKFVCKNCDFKCNKKGDWNRHIVTEKHLEINGNILEMKKTSYHCKVCNKPYKTNAGLWKHNKICNNNDNIVITPDNVSDKNLIVMLINDNKEMRNLLIEQSKEKDEFKTMIIDVIKNVTTSNITNNITNSNNNNNNNKTFNLQVFLNETCKDAMNMSEFIESIKIQLPDLEKMGEIGYVQGLSNIINNNLNTLDITQRPVHCTDQKRETIYIKNDNIWEKEDDNKTKLRKAINKIAVKNIKALPQFREKYPDYNNSSLKISDTYDKLVLEAMGGVGDEILKESKIIHNISKCITIDK
jgi:hypothetical protein